MAKTPAWTAKHYNAIAKEIRELFPAYDARERGPRHLVDMGQRGILSALALSLAHRFKEDNERFEVMKFLEACSPDNERFPITELWEDEDAEKNG